MSDDLTKLAYDLSYAQLRSQKEDLKALRNQASFCAAVSGLVASVFANLAGSKVGISFGSHTDAILGFSVVEALVLLMFAGSIAFAVLVVIGWKTCKFDLNPELLIHSHKYENDKPALFEKLAITAKQNFDENENVLDDAKRYLTFSLIFAWAQIPAWIVLLA